MSRKGETVPVNARRAPDPARARSAGARARGPGCCRRRRREAPEAHTRGTRPRARPSRVSFRRGVMCRRSEVRNAPNGLIDRFFYGSLFAFERKYVPIDMASFEAVVVFFTEKKISAPRGFFTSPSRSSVSPRQRKRAFFDKMCYPCPHRSYGHGDELRGARGPGEGARGMAHARDDWRGAARISRAPAVSLRAAVGGLDTRDDVFSRASAWRGDGVARRRDGRRGDSGGFSALVVES